MGVVAKINVDGKEYDLDELSPETRAEFEMLFFTEQRMRELRKELAVLQTARDAYGRAFQQKLQSEPNAGLTSLK
jgi:hypothetical protein